MSAARESRIVTAPATVVVHAGAGRWAEHRERGRDACLRAVAAGLAALRAGGSAVDAAIAAVVVLEDDPACNAGTGAVLRSDGTVEHDASVMDGLTRTSGALGSLRGYKNPILIAEQVRVDGRYHLLVGDGAATFARDHQALRAGADGRSASMPAVDRGETVGAVALDAAGGIASATSTGGMAGMPPGRVGDTPIVGAGTYASALAACSCTGAGDSFARACTAFWAVDRYRGDAEVTADQALERTLREFGGAGGLILLAADGTYAARRTTDAMPWAAATPDGEPVTGY